MDINEIKEYLPHRYPFLLVDRVQELDLENKRIRAYKNVSVNEPFFNGHFPQHPIMPGVLIIEAMTGDCIRGRRRKTPLRTLSEPSPEFRFPR